MSKDSLKKFTERHTSTKDIKCFLCLDTSNDARKCNHCSAIVCAKCIENWLDRNEMCPKCSHVVQATDFVATTGDPNCSIHPKETSKIFCRTCQTSICSQCVLIKDEHINHDYDNLNEDYQQISRLNKKLLEFLRKRYAEDQENLKMIELSMEILFNEHNGNLEKFQRDDPRILETQRLLDEYQQKRQTMDRTMKDDEMLIKDIQRRLLRSTCLSDQEEILQILQQHLPSIK